ncbi:MAG: hypothetical protein ACFFBD_10970 [Candidatus Hodarchaeota archaeon]
MKDRFTKAATQHKNRVMEIFARLNIKLPDVFGDNKFTYTALGIYEAIARGLTFAGYLLDLQNRQQTLKGQVRRRITRQLTFLHKHRPALESVLAKE